MTLNAVMALILRFFSRNLTDFQADYITVVEDRPILSVKYCLPVPVFYFWRKLLRTLQRGLSAIAQHLVKTILVGRRYGKHAHLEFELANSRCALITMETQLVAANVIFRQYRFFPFMGQFCHQTTYCLQQFNKPV